MKEMLSVIVVDDQQGPRETLTEDLKTCPGVGQVTCFDSYEAATLPIMETRPDILFLDVEMPGRTGLEFLNSVRPCLNFNMRVVFYTAYPEYMRDALRHSAFDFLLKPYKRTELEEIIARAQAEKSEPPTAEKPATVMPEQPSKLAIPTNKEILLVKPEELLMMNYYKPSRTWTLTLTDRSQHRMKLNTKAEDVLAMDSSLIRISSTCIVNLMHVCSIEYADYKVHLYPPFDDIDLECSRTYYSKIKEQFAIT